MNVDLYLFLVLEGVESHFVLRISHDKIILEIGSDVGGVGFGSSKWKLPWIVNKILSLNALFLI